MRLRSVNLLVQGCDSISKEGFQFPRRGGISVCRAIPMRMDVNESWDDKAYEERVINDDA